MTSALEAVRGAAGIEKRPTTVAEAIERRVPEFAKLLGKMDPVRFARIAISQVNINPKLAEDVPGLLSCIAIAATLKLEIGVLGQCYIVPYGRKNQFITGWMGHVDLVTRANKATVRTLAVREGDEFDCDLGSKPFVHFKPDVNGDEDRPLLRTVAIGHIKDMSEYPQIEVWGLERLQKHLNRYNKVGDRHYALQTGKNLATSHNFEQYARKIPLLQVVKYLPKSIEWQVAAQLDYQADAGRQVMDFKTASAVIEGDTLPEAKGAPTPYDQYFEALGWTAEECAKYLAGMSKFTEAQIKADLNAKIDAKNAAEE